MPEDEQPYQRRQADLDNACRIAVMQAMVPYQLRIDIMDREIGKLGRVVFGDELLPGLVVQMKDIGGKLDLILKQNESRAERWKVLDALSERYEDSQALLHSLKRTAEVTRWIVVFLGSLAGLVIALNALGVIHL